MEYQNIVGAANVTTIVADAKSMTLNNLEISLKLELLRIKSVCRIAADELESLHDLLEENNVETQKCEKLISALKGNVFLDYIKNYPDLEEKQNDILENK